MWFFAVKHVKFPQTETTKKNYTRVHVSFQSTSSCNITTVNALNSCKASIRKKERGRGANKHHWGIEMNEARDLHLKTYGRVDVMDHYIKNTGMFCRSWKYWHSAVLHSKAMAIAVAHDMYLECAEGQLDPL